MEPKPKPESLDDLLAQAEHYTGYSMRNIGRLPPAFRGLVRIARQL